MSGFDGLVGALLSKRYQLLRCIGEGGMGAVFEAVDRMDGSKYAIKLLHPEYAGEMELVERLYAEVQAALRLSHPNIARYFGFAQAENGSYYVIMELLEGVPLSRYVGVGKSYEVAQAVPILRAVLSALGAAHSRNIVHRDLKPDNIYLARTPTGQVPKLLDFGIAKIIDAAGGMTSKTKTGMLLGTPGYMSPEQINNAKTVDARTDLWSAGVILFELLSGTEPFPASSDMMKLTAILANDPVPIDQGRPHLAAWRDFFAWALAKDPDRRFPSAQEMARAMERAADPRAASVQVMSGVGRPSVAETLGDNDFGKTQPSPGNVPPGSMQHGVRVSVVHSTPTPGHPYGPAQSPFSTPTPGGYPSSGGQGYPPASPGGGYPPASPGGAYPTAQNYGGPGYSGAGYPGQSPGVGYQGGAGRGISTPPPGNVIAIEPTPGRLGKRDSEGESSGSPAGVPVWLAILGVVVGIAIGFALAVLVRG